MRAPQELDHEAATAAQAVREEKQHINDAINAGGADPVKLFTGLAQLEGLAALIEQAARAARMNQEPQSPRTLEP